MKREEKALAPYAGYDVLAKWDTPSFDDVTRDALSRRLNEVPARRFFSHEEFALLTAVVERLAPSFPALPASLIALWIDDRLHRNIGEGFRSEGAPPMQEAWRIGLAAIDGEARRKFATAFAALAPDGRDATLRAAQAGETDAALWRGLDPASFFADALLKTVAGLVYAHPSAWSDIGFGGPASPRGYVRLGFDARDPWEAKARR
ncbi:gluconate 2-dehydrogenase subunit 3 family protein [Methylocystis sp. JAN1]|uniref:gluconate 2-dehydrogenase subunit 3 family protein n=1 Tax=Methylocystis sp. JAN1 TaxID=3397211 RepID=UPI003FA300F7